MFLNTSENPYNWQNPRRAASFSGETQITATPTLTVRVLYVSATFSGETTITADGHAIQAGASVFRGETRITARQYAPAANYARTDPERSRRKRFCQKVLYGAASG